MRNKFLQIFLIVIFSVLFCSCSTTYQVRPQKEPDVEVVDVYHDIIPASMYSDPHFDVVNSKEFEDRQGKDVIQPEKVLVSSVVSIDELFARDKNVDKQKISSILAQAQRKREIQKAIENGEKDVNTQLNDDDYGILSSGKVASSATQDAFEYLNSQSHYCNAIAQYTYDDGKIYEIITSPSNLTDLRLKPGEKLNGSPFLNRDLQNWEFRMGVSIEDGVEVQHLVIKPKFVGLDTDMYVFTNERTYYFRIASFDKDFMTAVRFEYPDERNMFAKVYEDGSIDLLSYLENTEGYKIDVATADYNYAIKTYRGNPVWTPTAVFSDHAKTCIQFPVSIKDSSELPMPYIVIDGRETLVNMHLSLNGNLMILDTVLTGKQTILLKSGAKQQVKIYRTN